ncbi:hypothetical protein EST38_g13094 [Candolleomyces aberdarensis]|uniref:Uncharacterized protein n=1 Tax=Candolleomyces aberdarensis TaxID=2316362 RepID=A0A4Q2D0R9_9AGAR|nr:hypothetical protein EST38_g13094 [Candolleomyces aberdarensis]
MNFLISLRNPTSCIRSPLTDDDKKAVDPKPGTLKWTVQRAGLLDWIEVKVGGEEYEETEFMKQVVWTGGSFIAVNNTEPTSTGQASTLLGIWFRIRTEAPDPPRVRFYSTDSSGYFTRLPTVAPLEHERSGWLPMWTYIVKMNIMVGPHSDLLIAEAVLKNVSG